MEPETEKMETISKSKEDMASLYEHTMRELSPGEIVTGVVVSIGEGGVMVDVGGKVEGVVPLSEFGEDGSAELPAVGDELEVYVKGLSMGGEEGIYLSHREAKRRKVWGTLKESYQNGVPIKGMIKERIKGGFKVDIGIPAFLPLSQASDRTSFNPDSLVGKEFEMKIIDLNERNHNVILSRRVLLEEERKRKEDEFWNNIHEGDIVEGTVKTITNYGAFVSLGGFDGLLHAVDMSWKRVKHPSSVVSKGDKIKVKVLSLDREKKRVSLGMKQLTEDPWERVEEKYPEGSRVKGVVTGISDYGVFVELEDGVEGLIHISELSWGRRPKPPAQMFKEGDEVECVVYKIEKDDRRISLSLKRLAPDPWENIHEKYPEGSIVEAKVLRVFQDRAILEIEEGVEAILKIDDLSWVRKPRHTGEMVKEGENVRVKVLSIPEERRRLKVGLKQVVPDPWLEFLDEYKEGDSVTGRISSITDFGAFLQIKEGVEGLIHISQLDDRKVESPRDVVKEGEEVTAKILKIDRENRRISLSLKEQKKVEEQKEANSFMETQGDSLLKLGELLGKVMKKG